MDEESIAAKIGRNTAWRYGAALITTGIALVAGWMLAPVSETYVPYIAALSALSFVAWYCGLGPSVLSGLLTLAAFTYWIRPGGSYSVFPTWREAIGLAVFVGALSILVILGEMRRRENEKLRLDRAQLDRLVEERTAELDKANAGLRQLSNRLMQSQDQERRRIARDLHDSIGQSCAAMTMHLASLANDITTEIERMTQAAKKVDSTSAIVEEMSKEIRTISHLLHPPLLDEAGLGSALRWYADGFRERSGIQVDLEVPDDLGRLSQELETAIFRTSQECLTNIHRHSGSTVAKIRLTRSRSEICLTVEDHGKGMSAEKLNEMTAAGTPGVGIRGMRERIRQLGGTLEIHSDQDGTKVQVSLPLATSSRVAA